MSLTEEQIQEMYPLHWMVWTNRHEELKTLLESNKCEVEQRDPRGRTPLLLAVTLGREEAVRDLLDAGADVNCEKDGWSAVQEATATGSADLLTMVLSRRDQKRHDLRARGVPALLQRLSLAPDFYVEMKWEFTSWVPLVSRMCPFDTYKVYKRGANVRVDTTLVGFENNRWQRGDRTYIFSGTDEAASLTELDHQLGTWWSENLEAVPANETWPPPTRSAVKQRLSQPIAINYLDTDKISFERNKSGIWGWRQDKTEPINGYDCKVFSASNVELVSVSRWEHVRGGGRAVEPRAPLAGLLALADREEAPEPCADTPEEEELPSLDSLPPVSMVEYFSGEQMDRDVGRPRQVTTKVQKFKATMWLCEDYPLELQEQIMPILDLMATMSSSPHFSKLKDFIQMQLPAGFPVKIEIPLFHVLNARITFGNIFGMESPAVHVETIQEGDRPACVIDDACFAIPSGYRGGASVDDRHGTDDEEGLMQYAIQQSLMEAGTHEDQVDVWEALRGARPSSPLPPSRGSPSDLLAHEERQLQRLPPSLYPLEESDPLALQAPTFAGPPRGVGPLSTSVGALQAPPFAAPPRGFGPPSTSVGALHAPPSLAPLEESDPLAQVFRTVVNASSPRAIEASLASLALPSSEAPLTPLEGSDPEDPDPLEGSLAAALALSAREHARAERERLAEQRALDEAIRLSLLDR